MTNLILYTTIGCHLCECAATMLDQAAETNQFDLQTVDICIDKVLVDKYGIRIPVVKNVATNVELGWPFSADELLSLI